MFASKAFKQSKICLVDLILINNKNKFSTKFNSKLKIFVFL